MVVGRGNTSANKLHNKTIQYVKAPAQAKMIDLIMDDLTEEELIVYKRGRNAKPYSMAKNSSVAEYKKATGLEALTGYLYLEERMGRILELIQKGYRKMETQEGNHSGR